MNFILLLVVFGGLAIRMTSPADRVKYLGIATGFVRQLRGAAMQPRPEYEAFRDALRARAPQLFVTPALLTLNAAVFTAMLFGSGAITDADTLVGIGASLGTLTTNGEWWRLLTSAFVCTGFFHLLVNITVIAQLGAVLERLVGRFAVGAAYLSAGVFAGLVNLSSHPVTVTVAASGAVFGLYGLLIASLAWQTFHQIRLLRGRAANPDASVDESDDERPGLGLTVPPIALKRLGYGAAVFLIFSAVNGLSGAAEFAGLAVGLAYGVVLAGRAGRQAPATRPVAATLAAAMIVAIGCAVPLRNIADVRPEITRVVATEERTATRYQAAADAFGKGRISAEALAQLAERNILPELQAVDARLTALKHVPPEHQALVADAHEFLRLRSTAWRVRANAIRKTSADPGESEGSMDATWRIEAQTRFRANQMAMGNAEGAERASLAAFQRVKDGAPLLVAGTLDGR